MSMGGGARRACACAYGISFLILGVDAAGGRPCCKAKGGEAAAYMAYMARVHGVHGVHGVPQICKWLGWT
jgi:hypothetical protein